MSELIDIGRSLCTGKALTLLDALPAVLKVDSIETLESELVDAHVDHARAILAIDRVLETPEFARTQELQENALRWEFIARTKVAAYIGEIQRREAEAQRWITQ